MNNNITPTGLPKWTYIGKGDVTIKDIISRLEVAVSEAYDQLEELKNYDATEDLSNINWLTTSVLEDFEKSLIVLKKRIIDGIR